MSSAGVDNGDDGTVPSSFRRRTTTMQIQIIFLLLLGWLPLLGLSAEENGSMALIKFKSSLAKLEARFPKWDTAVPPCSGYKSNWGGVLCFDGYVWGLQLENMSLQGQIDVGSLVPLGFLRTLSFKNNNFQGQMPDWRKLGALKSLFLSHNRFSGEIPNDAFKGMTSLKKVDLANNDFIGQIPSSLQSPKLIQLRLENNHFTGKIPAISSENLKVLNVSNNQLDGPIPNNLQHMDPSSFTGNKALCGKPLAPSCDVGNLNSSPPSPSSNTSSSTFSTTLMIIFVILGVIIVILLLLICVRSRRIPTPWLGREGSAPYEEKGVHIDPAASPPDLMRASAEVLGSGTFGASYKAVLVDGEPLVVKRFKFYRKEEKLLVFDYINNGSLAAQLHGKRSAETPGLKWENRLKILKGVAKGLAYIHLKLPTLSLPHGHLKSSNVLVDNDFNPLLMDYALAPVVNSSQVHQVLLAYQSPEYLKTGKIGLLGCINDIVEAHSSNSTETFDTEMEISSRSSRTQLEKLLEIGIACCNENLEKRWDLDMVK